MWCCGTAGVVRFSPLHGVDATLNDWAGNISKLLSKVEKATQQISKESMVHRVPIDGVS
jgi:26S proteasome regulatory subunit RPN5 C-terminal domain